jgi:hypothetical protein
LLLAEVLICFGPLAAIFAMGLPSLPLSLGTLIAQLLPFPTPRPGNVSLWALLAPTFFIVGGGCGLFALLTVLQALWTGRTQLAYSRRAVIAMMALGLAMLLALGGVASMGEQLARSGWFFFWLPLFGSVHIAFLARNLLFQGYDVTLK